MATSPATQEKVLSDDQVAFYQRHGYLILENVLSAAELQDLRAASERLRDERARLAGDDRLAVIHNVALFRRRLHEGRAASGDAGCGDSTYR